MILPSFQIKSRINNRSTVSGMDCPDHCANPDYYANYPHPIEYVYNSRGYRDSEWPENFNDVVWCIGDSFTSGIGSPHTHTWPHLLERTINKRCINISLDGASNNWIARQVQTLLSKLEPKIVIIQWSFLHRREQDVDIILDQTWQEYYQAIREPSWPDCVHHKDFVHLPQHIQDEVRQDPKFNTWDEDVDLDSACRLHYVKSTLEQDLKNTQDCINSVGSSQKTKIIHSFIPDWNKTWHQLNCNHILTTGPVKQVDFARDGFHYDITTATAFVQNLLPLINKVHV